MAELSVGPTGLLSERAGGWRGDDRSIGGQANPIPAVQIHQSTKTHLLSSDAVLSSQIESHTARTHFSCGLNPHPSYVYGNQCSSEQQRRRINRHYQLHHDGMDTCSIVVLSLDLCELYRAPENGLGAILSRPRQVHRSSGRE